MTNAISHDTIRTPDWLTIRLQAPEVAAVSLRAILTAYDPIEKTVFALRGMAMLLIEERELYRFQVDQEVGDYYVSFDKFLKDICPNSWGYCRDALRAVKELKDMRFEDLLQIKRSNIEQLKKVSSSVRLLPDVVQAAKSLPEKDFVAKLNNQHAQHLDVKQPIAMAPAEDCDEFETAIALAMVCEHCSCRAEAIKAVAISYIQDHAVEAEHLKEETA